MENHANSLAHTLQQGNIVDAMLRRKTLAPFSEGEDWSHRLHQNHALWHKDPREKQLSSELILAVVCS